jgi:adenine-specific DNA-methyltransferase
MKKLDTLDPLATSADLVAANVAQLRALFPDLITESADGVRVNVDVLKQLIGDRTASDAEEKYGLGWSGKRRARQLALRPSTGTLRPQPQESVDWANTRNLLIEGDNLEVLKLLQKSYARKVKAIYIDPPYNTGRNLIYPNDYQDGLKTYLEVTGQVDGGLKLISTSEAGGRFHTNWLSMMYPRLWLARNLLSPDGVLIVTIDDNEQIFLTYMNMRSLFSSEERRQLQIDKSRRPRSIGRICEIGVESLNVPTRRTASIPFRLRTERSSALAMYVRTTSILSRPRSAEASRMSIPSTRRG